MVAAGTLSLTSGLAGCSSTASVPESTFGDLTTSWPTAAYDLAGTGTPSTGPTTATVVWQVSRESVGPRLDGTPSTPVVADGVVYVAGLLTRSINVDDTTSVVLAVGATSGDDVAVTAVAVASGQPTRQVTNGQVAPYDIGPRLAAGGLFIAGRDTVVRLD